MIVCFCAICFVGSLTKVNLTYSDGKASASDQKNFKLVSVDDIWEDFKVGSLPTMSKQAVDVISSEWNGMKKRISSCKFLLKLLMLFDVCEKQNRLIMQVHHCK